VFSDTYQHWLEPLRDICVKAGAAILRHYREEAPPDVHRKADESPLTAADMASHRIIIQELAQTGLPVLSEESPADAMTQRRQWQRFWMVDPLDGTKEFLGKTGEFTINIALIEGRRAVLGVVAIPLTGEVYAGVPGEGALRWRMDSWQPICCRSLCSSGERVVLTSRRHRGEQLDSWLAGLERDGMRVSREYIGSALKFCRLAEGTADYYPRFSPCSEWDTAAGQALLEGAGGFLETWEGQPLRYNSRASLLNPHFIASGRSRWPGG